MSESLLDTFASLDTSVKQILADTTSPRILSFMTLRLAATEARVDRLSAEHIVACLEQAGVALTQLSVKRALAGAKGFVAVAAEDGEVFYRLMTKGEREADSLLGAGTLSVVRIEKDQPRTARLGLSTVLSQLSGTVRACDPYFGVRTLDLLDHIPKQSDIRFLTSHLNDPQRQLSGALADFKKERQNAEFRVADKRAGLHDRYVVTDAQLIILGHGLKDIGGKESFVIVLDRHLVSDLLLETIAAFDAKWASGTVV